MSKTKYNLITTEQFTNVAVSMDVVNDLANEGQLDSCRPITLKEIRTKRISIISDKYYSQYKARESFKKKYHDKVVSATVTYFDKLSGEGFISLNDKSEIRLPIYACNIAGRKTWYPESACVYYDEGQVVEILINASMSVIFANGKTAGTLDESKWNLIKDNNLAFRCDDKTGELVSGLFA